MILALVALTVAPPAFAHFDSGSYSHSTSSCNQSIDPVTHVIYGNNARYPTARLRLELATGWAGDDSSSQYSSSHGFCTTMDGESYSACDTCNRDHERLNQTHHQDAVGRYETVGTPHHDRVVWPGCGVLPKHVAENYNGTRDRVLAAMSNYGWSKSWQYWGNTQPQRQCDGSNISSDGWVGWTNIF